MMRLLHFNKKLFESVKLNESDNNSTGIAFFDHFDDEATYIYFGDTNNPTLQKVLSYDDYYNIEVNPGKVFYVERNDEDISVDSYSSLSQFRRAAGDAVRSHFKQPQNSREEDIYVNSMWLGKEEDLEEFAKASDSKIFNEVVVLMIQDSYIDNDSNEGKALVDINGDELIEDCGLSVTIISDEDELEEYFADLD